MEKRNTKADSIKNFKMKINNINKISKVSNERVAMLSQRILEATIKANIQDTLNGKQYQIHADLSSQFQKATEGIKFKELSEPVNKSFNDRRELFLSMYNYAKGLCNAPETDMAEAANQVFKALNMYGSIASNQRLDVQSFRYIRIIEALKQPALAADLQKVQLTTRVTELDNIQREYESQFSGRSVKRRENVSASSIRRDLNEAIKLHIEELNWMALQTENEAIIKLCTEVNARLSELKISSQNTGTVDEPETAAASQLQQSA